MLALIVACAKNIAHADTCFNGLGSIRHLYIGEVIERHGMIVAVINLIDPLYLPVSGQDEDLQLMIKGANGSTIESMII